MSFSARVKEELSKKRGGPKRASVAELAALISMAGQVCVKSNDDYEIYLCTDNKALAYSFFYLVRRCAAYPCEIRMRTCQKRSSWILAVRDSAAASEILEKTGFDLCDKDWDIEFDNQESLIIDPAILKDDECKRAFLRGTFVAAGSVNDPDKVKSYHLEIVCLDMPMAGLIRELFEDYGIQSKITERRGYQVVYIKDGDDICDALTVMGASASRFYLENARITRDYRARVNREVNCVAANSGKAANASAKQIHDIEYLSKYMGLGNLPDGLEQIARLRLEYPSDTLAELGCRLDPPVGKSGVNHRLRRLSETAARLREERGDLDHDHENA